MRMVFTYIHTYVHMYGKVIPILIFQIQFRNLPSYDVFDPSVPRATCPINSTQHAFLPVYGVGVCVCVCVCMHTYTVFDRIKAGFV